MFQMFLFHILSDVRSFVCWIVFLFLRCKFYYMIVWWYTTLHFISGSVCSFGCTKIWCNLVVLWVGWCDVFLWPVVCALSHHWCMAGWPSPDSPFLILFFFLSPCCCFRSLFFLCLWPNLGIGSVWEPSLCVFLPPVYPLLLLWCWHDRIRFWLSITYVLWDLTHSTSRVSIDLCVLVFYVPLFLCCRPLCVRFSCPGKQ